MLGDMDEESIFAITANANHNDGFERFNLNRNFSFVIGTIPDVLRTETDPEYEQFLADVWVGIVLTLMVLSCVCCMCSCLLYHKFQQWKRSVIETQSTASNVEAGSPDTESLPSYTIVSGLPSYDEAIEQLKKIREQSAGMTPTSVTPVHAPTQNSSANTIQQLSVRDLFQKIIPTTEGPGEASVKT